MREPDRYRLPFKIGKATRFTGGVVYDVCWDDGSPYGIHALSTMDAFLASVLIGWSLRAVSDPLTPDQIDDLCERLIRTAEVD